MSLPVRISYQNIFNIRFTFVWLEYLIGHLGFIFISQFEFTRSLDIRWPYTHQCSEEISKISPLCIGLVSSSFLSIAVLNLSLLSISPPSWLLLFPGFSALLPSIFSGVYESFWLTECRRNFWIFPKDFSPGL